MIAPPAITRWPTSAHDRVFTSLFQAWLCGWVEQKLFIEEPGADKKRGPRFETVNDVNRLFTVNLILGAARDFMGFALSALGVRGRALTVLGRRRTSIITMNSSAIWRNGCPRECRCV
jgi:hypothetical protein